MSVIVSARLGPFHVICTCLRRFNYLFWGPQLLYRTTSIAHWYLVRAELGCRAEGKGKWKWRWAEQQLDRAGAGPLALDVDKQKIKGAAVGAYFLFLAYAVQGALCQLCWTELDSRWSFLHVGYLFIE